MVALKRAFFGFCLLGHSLLGAGVLGDGLGALRDGVLGQLSGQEEPDSGLDLPGGDGGPLVVVGELAGLSGDALEQVVDERVHDAHGLGGDTGVGVHLLQDLVDVDGVGLLPLALPLLLVALGDGLGGLARLGGSLSGGLGRHGDGLGGSVELMAGPRAAFPLSPLSTPAGDAIPDRPSHRERANREHSSLLGE